MATYAIGDIQGCYETLRILLRKIEFKPEKDTLWFVGDLVNRGPQSLQTLRFIRSLGERAVVVLGNHDLHLIRLHLCDNVKCKNKDTLHEVLTAPDAAELIDWLRHKPLMHVEGNYAMVHAGILPQWTLTQARALAGEVETELAAPIGQTREFLTGIWGNEPSHWDNRLSGIARQRVILNAFTRLRFCMPDGGMDFDSKGGITSAPDGYMPWFSHPLRQPAAQCIVFGHWSALGLYLDHGVAGLDTGCVWGRRLTAMRLEDRRIFHVHARKYKVRRHQHALRQTRTKN